MDRDAWRTRRSWLQLSDSKHAGNSCAENYRGLIENSGVPKMHFDTLGRMEVRKMATNETLEVGKKLVALCREGKYLEAIDSPYDEQIESIEPMAMPDGSKEAKGKKAIRD